MARYFNGSYSLTGTITGGTVRPRTLACWYRLSASPTVASVFSVGASSTSNASSSRLKIAGAGGEIEARDFGPSTGQSAISTSGATDTTTWHHACAVFVGSSERRAYFDGGNKGSNLNTQAVNAVSAVRFGSSFSSSSEPYTGHVAHPAIWNVALTDEEVAALGAGISPLMIRPGNIVHYWPTLGRDSPEIDIVGGATLTVNSATVSANDPPVLWLPKRRIYVPVSAGGTAYDVTLAESVAASDALANVATLAATLAESVAASEAIAAGLVAVAALAESVSATDAVSAGAASYDVDVSEAVTAVDSIAGVLEAVASLTESASTADQASSIATLVAALAESVSLTDSPSATGATYAVDLTEAASALDSLSAALEAVGSVSEALSTTDSASALATLVAEVAEAIAALDAATASGISNVSLTESVTLVDQVSAPTGFGETPPGRTITVRRGGRTITVQLPSRTITVH